MNRSQNVVIILENEIKAGQKMREKIESSYYKHYDNSKDNKNGLFIFVMLGVNQVT